MVNVIVFFPAHVLDLLLIAGGGDSSDDVTDLDKELSAVKWVNCDTLEVHVTCIII